MMIDVIAQHTVEVLCVLGTILAVSIGIDFFGHKNGHVMSFKESIGWFIFWVAVAIGYYFYIDFRFGADWADLYLTGYALEKSLSVDNMIVFMAIFASFGIASSELKHKILLWGIAGALIFRAMFVAAGTALFNLHWSVQVIFGIIVIYSAKAVLFEDDEEEVDYSKHWVVKPLSKFFKISPKLDGTKFVTIINGIKYVTPALICVAVIELSDVMFSFDSVPAVIGVTKEPLLVYSAMILAILGLRSLFFVLETLMKYLVHLPKAVAVLLVFVGGKLIAGAFGYHVPNNISLYVVLGLLAVGILASLVFPDKAEK